MRFSIINSNIFSHFYFYISYCWWSRGLIIYFYKTVSIIDFYSINYFCLFKFYVFYYFFIFLILIKKPRKFSNILITLFFLYMIYFLFEQFLQIFLKNILFFSLNILLLFSIPYFSHIFSTDNSLCLLLLFSPKLFLIFKFSSTILLGFFLLVY